MPSNVRSFGAWNCLPSYSSAKTSISFVSRLVRVTRGSTSPPLPLSHANNRQSLSNTSPLARKLGSRKVSTAIVVPPQTKSRSIAGRCRPLESYLEVWTWTQPAQQVHHLHTKRSQPHLDTRHYCCWAAQELSFETQHARSLAHHLYSDVQIGNHHRRWWLR